MLCQFHFMDADERDVFQFLKSYPSQYIAPREICRRAGGRKRFTDDPEWAKPILLRMAERGILEYNAMGQFRIKPVKKNKTKDKRWVSPDIAQILKESGLEVENAADEGAVGTDEYYEQL